MFLLFRKELRFLLSFLFSSSSFCFSEGKRVSFFCSFFLFFLSSSLFFSYKFSFFIQCVGSDEKIIEVCRNFMNSVFSISSYTFWEINIKPALTKRFQDWKVKENEGESNLKYEGVNLIQLVQRVAALCMFHFLVSFLHPFFCFLFFSF